MYKEVPHENDYKKKKHRLNKLTNSIAYSTNNNNFNAKSKKGNSIIATKIINLDTSNRICQITLKITCTNSTKFELNSENCGKDKNGLY